MARWPCSERLLGRIGGARGRPLLLLPQLLRKLPTGHPRGLALQQFTAAVLLEKLIPAGKAGGGGGGGGGGAGARSAVNRREAAALDPAAVIAAQPW